MRHPPPATVVQASPIPRFAVPLDENAFVDWLIDANPGDRIAYYRGHLGHDRTPSADVLDRRSRAVLHAVATRVMAAAGQGLVLPVQQRVGPEDCLYFAVKALRGRVGRACRRATPLQTSLNSIHAAEPATVPLAA